MKLRSIFKKHKINIFTKKKKDGKIRLHLGTGEDYWPNWVNIDSSPNAVCDLRMDFTQIRERYDDNSIAEVAMIHSLSYLRLWQARKLFVDIYTLLLPGGRLIIELPDLAKCAIHALKNENNIGEYLEAVRGLYAFDMNQIENCDMFTPYAFGWAGWHLKKELEHIGFVQVMLSEPRTHGPRSWRDIRVEATK